MVWTFGGSKTATTDPPPGTPSGTETPTGRPDTTSRLRARMEEKKQRLAEEQGQQQQNQNQQQQLDNQSVHSRVSTASNILHRRLTIQAERDSLRESEQIKQDFEKKRADIEIKRRTEELHRIQEENEYAAARLQREIDAFKLKTEAEQLEKETEVALKINKLELKDKKLELSEEFEFDLSDSDWDDAPEKPIVEADQDSQTKSSAWINNADNHHHNNNTNNEPFTQQAHASTKPSIPPRGPPPQLSKPTMGSKPPPVPPRASKVPPRTTNNTTTTVPPKTAHNNTLLSNTNNNNQVPPLTSSTTMVPPQSNFHNKALQGPDFAMNQFLRRQAVGKDLPHFSGAPEEWPQFINTYKRTDQLCNFLPDENLLRLQKCLKGKAKEAVQSLLIHPQSVPKVLETLERRFGRAESIIATLTTTISKIPQVREGHFEAIVDLANAVQNFVVTIESLGRLDYLTNPQLKEQLILKLPSSMKMKWGTHIRDLDPQQVNLSILNDWLDAESKIAETLCPINLGPSSTASGNHRDRRDRPNRRTESSFATTTTDKQSVDSKNCEFCHKGPHHVSVCRSFARETPHTRNKWVCEAGLCFTCLGPHQMSKCPSKGKACGIDGCTKHHHRILHSTTKTPQQRGGESQPPPETEITLHSTGSHPSHRILLRVAPVTLYNGNISISTFALFDEASTSTFMDENLAHQLNLSGPRDPLILKWTNSDTQQDSNSRRVKMGIKGQGQGLKMHALKNVRTNNNLHLPTYSIDIKNIKNRWDHIKNIPLTMPYTATPKILIGQDNIDLIIPREIREGAEGSPTASNCKLGWTIHGKTHSPNSQPDNFTFTCYEEIHQDALHQMVKNSFTTEGFGVKILQDSLKSKEEIKAQEILKSVTRKIENRWETGLLWRNKNTLLPESKSTALRRLYSTEKKCDKNPDYALQYCQQIDENIAKGYARKLTQAEVEIVTPRTWYLPHFGVIKPNKPGKIRVVYDAAAKSGGESLNDHLLTGPDLLNSLPGTLCKFREGKIAFSGDIKEMFLRVIMREEDCSSQRFLYRGMDRKSPPNVYQNTTLMFGSSSSPYSAQEIKNINAREHQQQYPEAAEAIISRHYMDDYLDSQDDEEKSSKLIEEVIHVHSQGSFVICNWSATSKSVLDTIPAELKSQNIKKMGLSKNEIKIERVLGLIWDSTTDNFSFSSNFRNTNPDILNGIQVPTKREMLRLVMSIFDPLGFLSSFTVKAKILLQDVWRSGLDWDDQVSSTINQKWVSWTEELKNIDQIKIPRWYFNSPAMDKPVDLHIFCDASEQSFAAIAYFRLQVEEEITTTLIMAKTRVSPLKPMSIPRLELQAAVMGARLAHTLIQEHRLKVNSTHFWTDSRTVLCWIRADARNFKQFVSHRVGEILENTDPSQWHWVPTKENVSDDATRN